MISLLIIWMSTLFKDWLQLHRDINGQWLNYLCNRFVLERFRRVNSNGRLELHDVWDIEDIRKIGLSPLQEEIEYANPKKNKSEDLFIFGSNTGERTTIEVCFKRRPLPRPNNRFDPLQDQVEVKFKLDDGKGNLYWMEEREVVQFSSNEYRAAGFAFEPYEGNKTGRIKFRGYLRRNDEDKLYYVQIRFLCLFFSKTFDHQRLFNAKLLAKELSNDQIGRIEDLLEDKIEQFCQIKGTFKMENDEESELFFLGTVGRRFSPKNGILSRKVTKINGFTKEGLGFQLGVVHSGKHIYRYGLVSQNGGNYKVLQNISLSKEELKSIATNEQPSSFEANFENDIIKFEMTKYRDNRRLVKVNEVEGMAFVEQQEFGEIEKLVNREDDQQWENELENTLVVPLDQDYARAVQLTGGKGASLAQLRHLSKDTEWSVPNAVVVTTSAYRVQIETMKPFRNKLSQLEQKVKSRKAVESACEEMASWFAEQKLEQKLVSEIEEQMVSEFGRGWQEKLFAVRSSAANEDSSEMSAAGQMTTYLGVRGIANLSVAIVKCWASQFAFVPVEYKRGYGQELNAPMAVVIQEMVDCDSAGVIFTANPTDGDERILTVTSNFGLGESVVSASADPDTFQLEIQIQTNSYEVERKVKSIANKTIGKKSLITRLNSQVKINQKLESGVINEQTLNGAQQQSLEDKDAIRLGNIALKIQQHYGNPRDIEWGLKDGRMYIFQSRPITNLDSTFTNYELMHEIDSAHMSEFEIYSRAHWGENFPGSSSWLALFFFLNGSAFMKGQIKMGMFSEKDFNPFTPSWGFMYNQLMFNLTNGPLQNIFKGYPKNDTAVATVFGFFGRHITDPDVLKTFQSGGVKKASGWRMKLAMPFMMIEMFFLVPGKIAALKRKMFEENYADIATPMKSKPFQDKLNFIFNKVATMSDIHVHRFASFGSTMKNMLLMKMLNSSSDTSNVEHDRNILMSHCNDVVSAEVPSMLRKIAKTIQNKQTFAQLSDEEALKVLRSEKGIESNAAQLFAQFTKRHGHRGYREMDPLHMPWRENPIPCIQVVKSLLKGGGSLEARQEKSIETVMAEIKTPLNWFKKLLIQHWLLPMCRNGVGYRENTKSLMVKFQDNIRKAMWQIAEDLVEQGILPDADLMFFLKVDEIKRLTGGERNPLLVMKAKQRKRLYQTMNKFKFDEFVKGFRMKPRETKKENIQITSNSVCMKGTAVTVGDIKARVCVAETIEEAVNIQQGDILLTYSTDIGWSPYFPLISGIVTELGGTVSHGAVIAREFGIPCLIAVEDVCQYFKTGDIAYLDTKTGTIVKVKQ